MPKKPNKKESAIENPKERLSTQAIVSIIGCAGIVIAACIGLFGTFISSVITYWSNRSQVEIPIIASQTAEAKIAISTPTPYITTVPQVATTLSATPSPLADWVNNIAPAGEQLDFSVQLYGIDPATIPDTYHLKPSPYSGIYLGSFYADLPVTSYKVEYENGDRVRADTDVCLINLAYSEDYQSPLNRKSDQILSSVVVFVDNRYEITITEVELLLTDYTDPRMDFSKVLVIEPGAGGNSGPFQGVRTDRIAASKSQTQYEVDFRDFDLKTFQGVNIFIPILLVDPGKYQFQVKVYALAHPIYQGDPSGKISLTSGKFTYDWVKIDDPRKYPLDGDPDFGSSSRKPDLSPCP